MTNEEIIEITRQAGGFSPTPEFLEAFAKLVAAKERQEWAKEFAGMGEWTAVHMLEARGEA